MTVTNMFNNQVDSLVKKVMRLSNSNGKDKEAYEAVRREVSGEYMRNGYLDMVSATLGELNDAKAEAVLNDVITHCSETFYMEDRILKPVVVPVGLHLRTGVDGEMTVSEGRQDDLNAMAMNMERRVGSRKVIFDRRIYTGKELYYKQPRKMCEFLLKLEAGEELPEGGPTPTKVISKREPQWEMVYFLGVEVLDLDQKDMLNEESSQRAMVGFRCHAEWALAEQDQILFETKVAANAKCYGFYYVNHGVLVGENQIRTFRLASMIKNMEHGVGGVRFRYVHDGVQNQIRLLIKSSLMTIEYKWKMMVDEGLEPFKAALLQSIDRVLPSDDVLEITQIDLFDYENEATAAGLTWAKGMV